MEGRQQDSPSATPMIAAHHQHVTRAELRLAVVGSRDVARAAPPEPAPRAPRRVLTTVLFTDVVDSTAHAVALGDERWLGLLERHEAMVRAEVRRAGGRPVVTVGDGVVATFAGAAAAVRCAANVVRRSRSFGLEVRCGLHCGETERRRSRLGGIVFHVAARVMHVAAPGEVLVSETLTHLVAGSSVRFHRRGRHVLHGLPGVWPIYGLADDGDDAATDG
jgi:class 3 adenylate cyclase